MGRITLIQFQSIGLGGELLPWPSIGTLLSPLSSRRNMAEEKAKLRPSIVPKWSLSQGVIERDDNNNVTFVEVKNIAQPSLNPSLGVPYFQTQHHQAQA